MRRSNIKWFVYAVFTSFLVTACAGTKLTSTQVDEARRGKPVADILVIGVTYKEDTRQLFEDTFVSQLKAAGVEAVSSLEIIPISEKQQLEKDRILKAVNKFNNDAVIITHLVGVEKKEVITRDTPGRRDYYAHYLWAYGNTHGPGYASTHKIVRLATNLYDVKTEKLIWSGRSETLKPDSITQIIDNVIKVVIKDLQKNQLLPPK
jgi:hypothetical protein